MTAQPYQALIIEGIQGLPPDLLAEIADFVYFVRKRVTQPQEFDEEMRRALTRADLRQLAGSEARHLEEEFADYDRLHPRE